MSAGKTECVLFTYGWLAARSWFTHPMCGLPRMVRITESLGNRLDHFRSETDQTYRGSKQLRDYCTSSYVRQNFLVAPIRMSTCPSVHPFICLCACYGVRCDERMFITSDKKEFYETLSSHFNFLFYCTVATNCFTSRSLMFNVTKFEQNPALREKAHRRLQSHSCKCTARL
jgi:hypothetical protein